ncbi:MAG: PKD domain-containing protein [Acidobacteria bacterium]|nr:PKD domain-containing protein [Acidobacteriota bacterium]
MLRAVWVLMLAAAAASALERPGVEFKIFQFPAHAIPRIDGDTADWAMVPASYVIGSDQLKDTVKQTPRDPKDLDVSVKVGWVKGLNRLYFLYEAYDNYWDFKAPDLHNDIFEVVVDGDLSGGPFIRQMHPDEPRRESLLTHRAFHGVHAQNYHIFTPAEGKDWTMVWGTQPWIRELPWANAAYTYNFKHTESGKLTLEFYITPFDYAPYEGPSRAVESKLEENKVIGLSWAILDYDDEAGKTYRGFWNLSHKTTMYGNASDLVAFRLMPLEAAQRPKISANWSFQILSDAERTVAFADRSQGEIVSWQWDFGDGTASSERNPVHRYQKAGEFVVVLTVKGPAGEARMSKVWDVTLP